MSDPLDGDSQIGNAGEAHSQAMGDYPDWYSVETFVTPYRHRGKKTMTLEVLEQLD